MNTQDARRLTAAAQQELRLRVVRAIVQQGLSQAAACRTFGVGKTSVWRWLKAYRCGGARRLHARRRGRPKSSSLKGHQAATTVRIITDRCPDQLKLPFALWTRAAVQELIEKRWGLRRSVWTVGRYLKNWGFTPQKLLRRAYEQNPAAVTRWLQQDLDGHQSRQVGLHGVQTTLHRRRHEGISAATAAACPEKGLPDRRQPSGAQVEEGATLA